VAAKVAPGNGQSGWFKNIQMKDLTSPMNLNQDTL
jgi:hypothetical protein